MYIGRIQKLGDYAQWPQLGKVFQQGEAFNLNLHALYHSSKDWHLKDRSSHENLKIDHQRNYSWHKVRNQVYQLQKESTILTAGLPAKLTNGHQRNVWKDIMPSIYTVGSKLVKWQFSPVLENFLTGGHLLIIIFLFTRIITKLIHCQINNDLNNYAKIPQIHHWLC